MSDNEERRTGRVTLRADVDFRRSGTHKYRVNILDFSPTGCRIELPERVTPDEIIWISLPGIEALEGRVRWVDEWTAGVEFERPIHPAVFEMMTARMTSAD
jgi:hypothetical protein